MTDRQRLRMASLALAAGLSAWWGPFARPAHAAPAPALSAQVAKVLAEQNAAVEKVHGWHRFCAWGPARFHRHVPGVGNVPCYHRGYGRRYWDDYGWRERRLYRRCMIEPWLCR